MISFKEKRYIILFIILALLFAFTASLNAADMNELNKELNKQQTEVKTESPSLFLSFVKLILALGLIIGAAWSILHIFSKQMNIRAQGTWINVVDEVMLGQNRGIVLCEIGEKLYALGITDHNINLLFEVTNPKLLEEVSQADTGYLKEDNKFNEFIRNQIISLLKGKPKNISQKNKFSSLMEQQLIKQQELSKYYISNEHNQSSSHVRSEKNEKNME
ncbi:flagellar biosynthetic protein FliO [Thermosyntropha sp.]|uniref:flagellar biosynthetic protein FliO n=1 Tax=Thermosyntropha sp. TaxID=2740820 RepID=UPI0025E76680|nr:flagellar biosynthetic protein FliO [Thermosyntropha sp.]MBO8159361.1 flagellar biosynthetic protein FliO [Thermosyntropha sp.]